MTPLVLAIETSCDETAVAILRGFHQVIDHRIATQVDIHAAFGGVVPEIASRSHLKVLPVLVKAALGAANLKLDTLDAFAATSGPGLAAALMVGAAAAKGMALGNHKPFLGINHIEGHLLSPFFGEELIPPHIGLVVSGGHTLLFDVQKFGNYSVVGKTYDDAAGEAFDKVAKLLNLGYPGGIQIDKLARSGDPSRYKFPRSMLDSGDLNFSFSGLKTSVRYFLESGYSQDDLPDICASFEQTVVDVLVHKTIAAAKKYHRNLVAISGGVSANSLLREMMSHHCEKNGLHVRYAKSDLCTDNALMIAYVAAHRLKNSESTQVTVDITPNFNELFWKDSLSI